MYIDNIYHTDYPFERKVGEWECLGHLMRPLDHPLSIWFKCSECGYEYYWLLSGFPKECPGCHATMASAAPIPRRTVVRGGDSMSAMKNLYLYDPVICNPCPKDCDTCPNREVILSSRPAGECPPDRGDCEDGDCDKCWIDYLRGRKDNARWANEHSIRNDPERL